MSTFKCNHCKKRSVVGPASPNNRFCLRCKLKMNKVLLHRCFRAITEQSDMKEFKADMEQWYV